MKVGGGCASGRVRRTHSSASGSAAGATAVGLPLQRRKTTSVNTTVVVAGLGSPAAVCRRVRSLGLGEEASSSTDWRLRASMWSPSSSDSTTPQPSSSSSSSSKKKKNGVAGDSGSSSSSSKKQKPPSTVANAAASIPPLDVVVDFDNDSSSPLLPLGSFSRWAMEGGKRAVRLLTKASSLTKAAAISLTSMDEDNLSTLAKEVDKLNQVDQPEKTTKPVVSVKSFLKDVSHDAELLRRFRYLSSMSEQAYYTRTLTEGDVRRRYKLRLVATSEDYKEGARAALELGECVEDVFQAGDGMCQSPKQEEERISRARDEIEEELDLEEMYRSLSFEEKAYELGITTTPEIEEEAAEVKGISSSSSSSLSSQPDLAETDNVGVVGRALDTAKGFTTFVSSYTKNFNLSKSKAQESVEAEGQSVAKARSPDNDPCEWLVCDSRADEPASNLSTKGHPTRYISLQGSDSLDHWVTNLSFDPVDFEGKDLNVKIHAGIYNAAEKLMTQLQFAVEEHIEAHGKDARFVFTGHSLGGAIASCLVMMLVHRGIVDKAMVEGVYTYGCPAFVCENCSCECEGESCECAGDNVKLLERLGLSPSVFNHLCMHRDIVPKAFACDYTLVKSIMGKMDQFKNHGCLKGSKEKNYTPALYRHVGDVYFVQPSTEYLQFARPEGDSPLLPKGQGIWKMVEPPQSLKLAMRTMNRVSRSLQNEWAFGDMDLYTYASDMNHAIIEIFNNPHPIETLKDKGAYGHEGGVSRFHKPKNYTRAVGVLLMDNANNKM